MDIELTHKCEAKAQSTVDDFYNLLLVCHARAGIQFRLCSAQICGLMFSLCAVEKTRTEVNTVRGSAKKWRT